MICSIKTPPEGFDIQAHCRSLALQQMEMLTEIAELSMQLVRGEGARALDAQAQAKAAEPKTDEAVAARAEAREAGLAFNRFSRTVQQSLAQRARTADKLCAQDRAETPDRLAARKARRDRHRDEVREVLCDMICEEIEDEGRFQALKADLEERIDALYEDQDVRVEDRPVGSVMAGVACGLGLSAEWQRWRGEEWPATPRPRRPEGSPAEIRAIRAKRRKAVIAEVERDFAECADPAWIPALRAGLAVRLQEPDGVAMLDTETIATAADRLCRSLGLSPMVFGFKPKAPDTG
jgi:hypothetical protein